MALVDTLITELTQAATSAAGNRDDAVAKSTQAQGATDHIPLCLEGFTSLEEARHSASLAHSDAGKAQGLFDALTQLQLLAILNNTPSATQMSSALAQRDAAASAAGDADAAVLAAEPSVINAHDACILSTLIQPIIDCVQNGITTATNATTHVNNPLGGAAGRLNDIVHQMIQSAAGTTPTVGAACNEGVEILARAAKLITDQTNAAQLVQLQGCLSELQTAAPTNPQLAAGQSARDAAQAIIDDAHNRLFSTTDPDILKTWRNRITCTIPTTSLTVHVMDHDGDDFGDENDEDASRAVVGVVNFPFNLLLPELPSIAPLRANESGRITIGNIPLAPLPMELPTGTPPTPPGLPTTDAATLHFTAVNPARATGSTDRGVNHAGVVNGGIEITIQVPDSSPSSP
jgi:hypothetical protein